MHSLEFGLIVCSQKVQTGCDCLTDHNLRTHHLWYGEWSCQFFFTFKRKCLLEVLAWKTLEWWQGVSIEILNMSHPFQLQKHFKCRFYVRRKWYDINTMLSYRFKDSRTWWRNWKSQYPGSRYHLMKIKWKVMKR